MKHLSHSATEPEFKFILFGPEAGPTENETVTNRTESEEVSAEEIQKKIDETVEGFQNLPEEQQALIYEMFEEAMNSEDAAAVEALQNEVNQLFNLANESIAEKVDVSNYSTTEIVSDLRTKLGSLPEDIQEKVGQFLDSNQVELAPGLTLEEQAQSIQDQINQAIITERTHVDLSIGEANSNSSSVEVSAIASKNPFPKGPDSLQEALNNESAALVNGRKVKGFIEADGMTYYNESGQEVIDKTVTLGQVLQADLAPLRASGATAEKLYEAAQNSGSMNFSMENAQILMDASDGIAVQVLELQTAIHNLSERFFTNPDNKYGQSSRRETREVSLIAADQIDALNSTPLQVGGKKTDHWYVGEKVDNQNNIQGGSSWGNVWRQREMDSKNNKNYFDQKKSWSDKNELHVTPVYTDGSKGKTVVFKKGGAMPELIKRR